MEQSAGFLYIKIKTVHQMIAYLALLDLIVFPYFPFLIMPYSLPIVAIALITRSRNLQRDRQFQLFFILAGLVLASLLIGTIGEVGVEKYKTSYKIDNIKRAFQFLSTFIYFFYFKSVGKYLDMGTVKKILIFSLSYIMFIGVWVLIDPGILAKLKETVYTATTSTADHILISYRFSYLFSDPNTAAYFVLILILFLGFNFENSLPVKLFLLLSSFFIMIICKSNGAIVSVMSAILVYLFFLKGLFHLKFYKNVVLMAILGLLLVMAVFGTVPEFRTEVERNWDRCLRRVEASSGFSKRTNHWLNIIQNEPLMFFLGNGYYFSGSYEFNFPHTDHIRMVYSYGMFAYLIILYLLFKNVFRHKFLFLWPALVAFSINSLIDSQKLFGIVLVFLGLLYSRQRERSFNRRLESASTGGRGIHLNNLVVDRGVGRVCQSVKGSHGSK